MPVYKYDANREAGFRRLLHRLQDDVEPFERFTDKELDEWEEQLDWPDDKQLYTSTGCRWELDEDAYDYDDEEIDDLRAEIAYLHERIKCQKDQLEAALDENDMLTDKLAHFKEFVLWLMREGMIGD